MAGITQGSNFPDYGGGHASGNDPLGNFLRWAWYGKQQGAGLDAVPGQFLQSINPSSKAGLANLLSMFAGGGKFDASPQMGELGMPNQFEPYSVGKASVGGHLGHDKAPDAFLEALKSGQHQHAHDLLFGGTVHARGAIPKRPAFNEPPADTAAAIAQKLGISPARVRAQMKAAEQHNTNVAKEQTAARVLHSHGISQPGTLNEQGFLSFLTQLAKSGKMPEMARVYRGRTVRSGTNPIENLLGGGTRAERQRALRLIVSRQLLPPHHN